MATPGNYDSNNGVSDDGGTIAVGKFVLVNKFADNQN